MSAWYYCWPHQLCFFVAGLTGINLDISAWYHILWYRSFDLRHFFLRQLLQQRLECFASLKNTFWTGIIWQIIFYYKDITLSPYVMEQFHWAEPYLRVLNSGFLFFRGKSGWEFLIPQTIYFCNFIAKGQHYLQDLLSAKENKHQLNAGLKHVFSKFALAHRLVNRRSFRSLRVKLLWHMQGLMLGLNPGT